MSLERALATAARAAVLGAFPQALALWAFGSRVSGQAGPQSDLDLAVLVPGKAEALALWNCAQQLARDTGIEVDLLDLRATSTVMAHQVLSTGECLYALEPQAGSWAAFTHWMAPAGPCAGTASAGNKAQWAMATDQPRGSRDGPLKVASCSRYAPCTPSLSASTRLAAACASASVCA